MGRDQADNEFESRGREGKRWECAMKRLIYVVPLWLTIGVVDLEATDVKDIGWKA